MNGILMVACLIRLVRGLPSVAFPFNSQVPAVARVSQPYSFQFAEATFNPDGGNLTYSLMNAPTWLSLDVASRTLSGTPGPQNNGANTFAIQATSTSGTIGMSCTLVVTDGPSPRLARDVSSQLAASGTLAGPSTLSLHPGDSFTIVFANDTFQGPPPILRYYATMSDHTPLASWIGFDPQSSSFFGIAQTLSVESQAFSVDLIASDVLGFSGAIAPFTLLVSKNQFAFRPQQESLNVTAGTAVRLTDLKNQLSLNGLPPAPDQITSATIDGPNWLSLDPKTLTVTGTPPNGFTAQEVNISVVDTSGDMAVKSLLLRAAGFNLFNSDIGQLTAVAGQPFRYALTPSLFSQTGLSISVSIPASATWLSYDSSTMEISGTPPQSSIDSNIAATLFASSQALSASESQPFSIRVVASQSSTTVPTASSPPFPRATGSQTPSSPSTSTSTSTSTKPAMLIGDAPNSNHKLSRGAIAGIVIGSLLALFLLVLLAIALCRCFRDEDPEESPRRSPNKRDISGPFPYPPQTRSDADGERRDISEKMTPMLPAPPPQVHLEFNHSPIRGSKLAAGTPVPSSIGDGEAVIRADGNIPIYGTMSDVPRDRHDSYSAATELTRLSTMGKSARSKRSSWKPFHNRHSRADYGLGIDMTSQQGQISNRPPSTINTWDGATHTTMTRTDSDAVIRLPSPSKRNTRSTPRMSVLNPNRRSVRLVEKSDPSLRDPRSFLEKRQSYIRNRASSGVPSVLFTTASRADESVVTRAHSKSSTQTPPPARNPSRLTSAGTSTFAPSFPRTLAVHAQESPIMGRPRSVSDESSNDWTTASTRSHSPSRSERSVQPDWVAEAALPRHQRNWVAPGEASPTPPPSSVLRFGAGGSVGRSTSGSVESANQRWKRRLNRDSAGQLAGESSSPLSRVVVYGDGASHAKSRKGPGAAVASSSSGQLSGYRNSLREPLKLISNDSLSRNRERIAMGSLGRERKSSGLGSVDQGERPGGSSRNFSGIAFI